MGINANHPFEDLDGVKCSVVEKNCSPERVEFLKKLLEFNRYEVKVVKSPPPKVVAKPAAAVTVTETTPPPAEIIPPAPETFTVGVTDVMFNSTNAVFGRLLHTPDGHIVTLAYWEQRESIAHDEVPYFSKNK